jgi:Protein of unknown function (DUF1168)
MEKEFVTAEEDRIFAEKLLRNKVECEEKTKRNAEKRKRKKGKQMAAKKKSAPGAIVSAGDEDDNDSNDDETSDLEEAEREIKVAPKVATVEVK